MRPKVSTRRGGGNSGSYFTSSKSDLDFVSSGCTLLDAVLGGGYVLGRIANLVGDKSTGKTLLAIEACANFSAQYPEGKIWYAEAEAAFDRKYAAALGLPVKQVEFVEEIYTVEDVYEKLEEILKSKDAQQPGLFILDSLDALSDRAELDRGISEGTYGASKPKQLSQMFRRLVQKVEKSKVCIIIISQVRDNIGVTFGRKTTRSGGRALDFYASQVLYLAHMGTEKRTINKVQRPVGVTIKAKCDKNKVGLALRECQFSIKFGYGVDDFKASLDWLAEVGKLDLVGTDKNKLSFYIKKTEALPDKDYHKETQRISKIVKAEWNRIENGFLPTRTKYR